MLYEIQSGVASRSNETCCTCTRRSRCDSSQRCAHGTQQHPSFRRSCSSGSSARSRWPSCFAPCRRSPFPAGCLTGRSKDVPNWIKISVQRSESGQKTGLFQATSDCQVLRVVGTLQVRVGWKAIQGCQVYIQDYWPQIFHNTIKK